MSRARDELIRIHKNFLDDVQREVQEVVGVPQGVLRTYQEEYDREFQNDTITAITKKQLLDTAESSQLLYIGDYHTLRQAQRTLVRFLRELAKRGRPMILCLEMLRTRHQEVVVKYLNGIIDETEFLAAIEYDKTWGFNWANYRTVFQVCIQERIPIVAMNEDFGTSRDALEKRDRLAAEAIYQETSGHPDKLVVAFYGDLHLAKSHVPGIVERKLDAYDEKRKTMILYQNVEPIYWKLVEQRLEQKVDIVRLSEDRFCILNCPPWIKLRSYLNWNSENDELVYERDSIWEQGGEIGSGGSFDDQFRILVDSITEFLGITPDCMDDYAIYSPEDLDFFEVLENRYGLAEEELIRIRMRVINDGAYFIPSHKIVYLGDIGIHSVAEMAGQYIFTKLSGYEDRAIDEKDHFYRTVLLQALGFFCSKIINFRRRKETREDFECYLKNEKGKRLAKLKKGKRIVAAHVIAHLDWEKKILNEKGRSSSLRKIYSWNLKLNYAISKALGNIFGSELYDGVMEGMINRLQLRVLFTNSLSKTEAAFEEYMRIKGLLRSLRLKKEFFDAPE